MCGRLQIVRFYGAARRSSRAIWLLFEYLPYRDLARVLHSREHREAVGLPADAASFLTLRRRLGWACDVAMALDFMHSRGAVHRDIRSASVLVSPRLDAVLTDFGHVRKVVASDAAPAAAHVRASFLRAWRRSSAPCRAAGSPLLAHACSVFTAAA